MSLYIKIKRSIQCSYNKIHQNKGQSQKLTRDIKTAHLLTQEYIKYNKCEKKMINYNTSHQKNKG